MTSAQFLEARRVRHEARLERRRAIRTERRVLPRRERVEILDRDAWTCHICALPIDPDAAWPAPDSGTVDHVIPLACGGSNEADNLAAAHAYCNNVKSDRQAFAV